MCIGILTQDVADFVFGNGPLQVQALPSETNPEPAPPSPDDPPEKQARAWWNHTDNEYRGWAESVAYLTQMFREHGPFDGVLGFSQGACAAALLAASIERPENAPYVCEPIQTEPLRFVICVSGFYPCVAQFDTLLNQKITTPLLLVIGEYVGVQTHTETIPLLKRRALCTLPSTAITAASLCTAASTTYRRPRRGVTFSETSWCRLPSLTTHGAAFQHQTPR